MAYKIRFVLSAAALLVLFHSAAGAEILAMMNYESKSEQTTRREGIAIVDMDPKSKNFGKILADIPLPADFHAHHIFYNKDASKAYITALKTSALHVMSLKKFPYRIKPIKLSGCNIGEDVVFSDDNKRWYLTCMGSDNVIVGDAVADKAILETRFFKRDQDEPFRVVSAPRAAMVERDGHVIPTRLTVENRIRGTSTDVLISDLEINPEIDDHLFSVGTLEHGRRLHDSSP